MNASINQSFVRYSVDTYVQLSIGLLNAKQTVMPPVLSTLASTTHQTTTCKRTLSDVYCHMYLKAKSTFSFKFYWRENM